ncbi:MAG: proteasome subunit beta [Actinomycetales bacterium]|nr:proteasome subunit beta [Actinomycetales bacterium]
MTASPGLPDPYRLIGTSSFVEFLQALHPERLPRAGDPSTTASLAPHGTTIVALRTADGVVMAGDRRATIGNVIAQHDIEKVFVADDHSVVGIAGSAGLAVELVRVFQVELEHYEKIEGVPLSLDGKANRLATLLRSNLGLALQGLMVVPLFAGYDLARSTGRIFSYDPTGGRYEEHDFYAVGSGSTFARGSLKKLYRRGGTSDAAVRTALEALYDAADDDSATAGPDMARGIYPVVAVVDGSGARILPEDEVSPVVRAMVEDRMVRPDGGPQDEEAGA